MKIKIPVKVESTTEMNFKSLGFDLRIVLLRLNVKPKGMSIINARIYVNKELTNTVDFTEWFLEEKKDKFLPRILSSVFNQKFTQYLMRNI